MLLTKFVEGIIDFLDPVSTGYMINKIVRVGGRSQNDRVTSFSLKNNRHRYRGLRDTPSYMDLDYVSGTMAKIKWRLRKLNEGTIIMRLELIKDFMSQEDKKFFQMNDEVETSNIALFKLLDWLELSEKAILHQAEELQNQHCKAAAIGFDASTSIEDKSVNIQVKTDAEMAEDSRRIEEDDDWYALPADYDEYIGIDMAEFVRFINREEYYNDLRFLIQQVGHKMLEKLRTSKDEMTMEATSKKTETGRMPLNSRWRLYRYWVKQYKSNQLQELDRLKPIYQQLYEQYKREQTAIDEEILKESRIIAITTTAAAKYHSVLRDIGPRIVIVEEAAEVLEAHIITALSPKCEHLILIGDHKQLEPKSSVYELALRYNLGLSMFERMLNNGLAFHCLHRQHRMRPEISLLVKDIYPNLIDNENVLSYDHIKGLKKDLFFINHCENEDFRDDLRSYSNRHEAEFLVSLCRYLILQGYSGKQITVLVAYTGQMFVVQELMPRDRFDGVRISSIDNFQGEENDIVLLSLVRSNEGGNIGFLKRENRICVALSRAKKGLYVIGNFVNFINQSAKWKQITAYVKTNGSFGNALPLYCQNHPTEEGIMAITAKDFTKAPDGGCDKPCESRLQCGHACRLYCHPFDPFHEDYTCKKGCLKTCINAHICQRICHYGEECKCPVEMTKRFQCRHDSIVKCCVDPDSLLCNVFVEKMFPCCHIQTVECHEDITSLKCKQVVKRTLTRCGHETTMECWKDEKTYECRVKVTKRLPKCDHEAEMECWKDVKTYKCRVKITKQLPYCDHQADMECCVYPIRYRCKEVVTKTLRCNHEAEMECHTGTDTYSCKQTVTRKLDCDHEAEMECYESPAPFYRSCKQLVTYNRSNCRHFFQVPCLDSRAMLDHTRYLFPHRALLRLPLSIYESGCPCEEKITKHWECSHSKIIPCYQAEHAICGFKCKIHCERNHICQKTCHYPNDCKCQIEVIAVLPICGHTETLKCYEDPSSVQCKELVNKRIENCGHRHMMECCQNSSEYPCTDMVEKITPGCNHVRTMMCHENPESFICEEQVRKTLPLCGHVMEMRCCVKPESMSQKCKEIVRKELPKCGHEMNLECRISPDSSTIKCLEPVTITLSKCAHEMKILCYDNPEHVRASYDKRTHKVIHKRLSYPMCNTKVPITYQCGHAATVDCCYYDTSRCEAPCEYKLTCGHRCPRRCADCASNNNYVGCSNACNKTLICGHACQSTTCGNCSPCGLMCDNDCAHKHCTLKCILPCKPCNQPCSWTCPHFTCSTLCHEDCDRPRCSKRCSRKLKCRHTCLGFCGEPCPKICDKCNSDIVMEIREGRSLESRLVSLKCGHIFTSKFLDEFVEKRKASDQIQLPCCPKCNVVMKWHPRYGNTLKHQWRKINAVKKQICSVSNRKISEVHLPYSPSGLDLQRLYLNRFSTFLNVQKKIYANHNDFQDILKVIIQFKDKLSHEINGPAVQLLRLSSDLSLASSLWLLCVSYSYYIKIENDNDSDDDDDNVASCDTTTKLSNVHLNMKKVIFEAQSILKFGSHRTSESLKKLRKLLEPYIDKASLNNVECPLIDIVIGTHMDDWKYCVSRGHILPQSWPQQKSCPQCDVEEDLLIKSSSAGDQTMEQPEIASDSNRKPHTEIGVHSCQELVATSVDLQKTKDVSASKDGGHTGGGTLKENPVCLDFNFVEYGRKQRADMGPFEVASQSQKGPSEPHFADPFEQHTGQIGTEGRRNTQRDGSKSDSNRGFGKTNRKQRNIRQLPLGNGAEGSVQEFNANSMEWPSLGGSKGDNRGEMGDISWNNRGTRGTSWSLPAAEGNRPNGDGKWQNMGRSDRARNDSGQYGVASKRIVGEGSVEDNNWRKREDSRENDSKGGNRGRGYISTRSDRGDSRGRTDDRGRNRSTRGANSGGQSRGRGGQAEDRWGNRSSRGANSGGQGRGRGGFAGGFNRGNTSQGYNGGGQTGWRGGSRGGNGGSGQGRGANGGFNSDSNSHGANYSSGQGRDGSGGFDSDRSARGGHGYRGGRGGRGRGRGRGNRGHHY